MGRVSQKLRLRKIPSVFNIFQPILSWQKIWDALFLRNLCFHPISWREASDEASPIFAVSRNPGFRTACRSGYESLRVFLVVFFWVLGRWWDPGTRLVVNLPWTPDTFFWTFTRCFSCKSPNDHHHPNWKTFLASMEL